MACLQELCASMQRELTQRTASHSRHIDELDLQLENAKKELSMLQVSLCYQNISLAWKHVLLSPCISESTIPLLK